MGWGGAGRQGQIRSPLGFYLEPGHRSLSVSLSLLHSSRVGGSKSWWSVNIEPSALGVFQVLAGKHLPERTPEPRRVFAEAAGVQPADGALRAAAGHLGAQEMCGGRGASQQQLYVRSVRLQRRRALHPLASGPCLALREARLARG